VKKSRLLIVCLIVITVFAFAGCSGTGSTDQGEQQSEVQKEVTIGVFLSNAGDPYFQNKSYGYVQGAQMLEAANPGLKINLEMYDAGGYQYSEKQIGQIEDAMQRNIDAIIITTTNGEALVPIIDQAMAKGIPVVNDDVLVNTDTTTVISENSYRVGRNAADYIARKLNNKGNVILLQGPAGAGLFTERSRGAHDEFGRYPDIKIIGEQWHECNILEGRRIMEDYIQAFGKEIDAVWSTNTVVAMGAVEALKAANFKPGEVIVTAIDLHDEGIKYMDEGWITGLVPCQPVKLARIAVTNAYKAAIGENVPARIYTTDDIVIDKETLPTFDTSDSMAPADWKPPIR